MIEHAIIEKLPADRCRQLTVMTKQPLDAFVADERPGARSELDPRLAADEPNHVWQPGVWERMPWAGLGSLFIILLRQFLFCSSLGTRHYTSFII